MDTECRPSNLPRKACKRSKGCAVWHAKLLRQRRLVKHGLLHCSRFAAHLRACFAQRSGFVLPDRHKVRMVVIA